MAKFLKQYRGLKEKTLEWFSHHSEVDIRHAEEGLHSVVEFVKYYGLESQFETILELTTRENIFIKWYFGEVASAKESGMLS